MVRSVRALPFLVCAVLAGATGCSSGSTAVEASSAHPFLLVRAADYQPLRARATRSPWRELAAEALRFASQETFDPLAPEYDRKTRMTDLCGALALAYVLEPSPLHVDKLRVTLAHWPAFFLASSPPGEVVQVRWRQSAMILAILALDVMHDALEPAERAAIEGMLDDLIAQWWNLRAQDGTASTPGVAAVWALYRGDRGRLAVAKALYLERLFAGVSPGGVYDSGTGYAWVRHGGDRISKYVPIDILEFTGEDDTLYADPRLKSLYEWMFRGAFTAQRRNTTFGDSDPSREIEGLLGYVQPYGAGKLSAAAGRNAAWLVRDVKPRPILPNYVLMDDTILAPEAPTSALFGDSATFWENAESPDSLMGALWSPRSSGSHAHKDVNAVHLYAYGHDILRNSGYCGSGVGIDATFGWEWVHETAASSNTATIGGLDHASKTGGGILEGFTARRFDYAASGSGPALANGTHTRALVMVHGEPGMPGYFVLHDEIEADTPGAEARLAFHPDTSAVSIVSSATEYEALVGESADAVAVTAFLGTPPAGASLLDGGLCAFDDKAFIGKYLEAVYATDELGRRNIVTLIVPHDDEHAKPALERVSLLGSYSGARVSGAGAVDVALESSTSATVTLSPESFQGRAVHFRRVAGELTQYFVRVGREFDDGGSRRRGFRSDAEISVFVRGREAHVIASSGATVVFYDPVLPGAAFDIPAGRVLSAATGRVEIALEPGTHAFDLGDGGVLD